MKGLKVLLILSLLLCIYVPCFAINLGSNNLITNLETSLKEEPEHWILRNSAIYYIQKDISIINESSWPELRDECLVHISFDVLSSKDHQYIYIKKPLVGDGVFLKGNHKESLMTIIRQMMFQKLYSYGVRMPVAEKKVESKSKPETINAKSLKKL